MRLRPGARPPSAPPRHDAAPKAPLRPRQVGEARGDLAARERLDDGQRGLTARERRQDDALQRLVVLPPDGGAGGVAPLPPPRPAPAPPRPPAARPRATRRGRRSGPA